MITSQGTVHVCPLRTVHGPHGCQVWPASFLSFLLPPPCREAPVLPWPRCSPHSSSALGWAPSSCLLSHTHTPSADVFPLLPYPTPAADTVGRIFLLTCNKIIPLSPARYEFTLPTFFRHLQQLPCFVVLVFFYIKPAFNSVPKDLVLPHVQALLCEKGVNTKLCVSSFFITQVITRGEKWTEGGGNVCLTSVLNVTERFPKSYPPKMLGPWRWLGWEAAGQGR